MIITNKEKTTALQNSIETGTLVQVGYINPNQYKQHNINIEDGFEAIVNIHEILPMDQVSVNVVRAFQDGDYAFVHVDYFLFEPTVAFDIHRYENGLAVEHWDNLQPNTKKPNKSGRTMTDGKTKAIDHDKTETNKLIAKQFIEEILIKDNLSAITNFFDGDKLIQHSPYMGDGVLEFMNILEEWKQNKTPMVYTTLHKVLGEGNFVLTLCEGLFMNKQVAFYDLFRLENEKIIEHWDVIEEIPARNEWKNNNGKF